MSLDVGICKKQISGGEDGVRVILPVLWRPERAGLVLASLRASEQRLPVRPLFVLSYGDRKELAAVLSTGADYVQLYEGRRSGDYARKINTGAALTSEPWIFTAADDVHFHPGWADIAVSFALAHNIRAVGVNDLGRWSTRHKEPPAPHFLVARSYYAEGTIDEPNAIFHPGYDHWYVDTEFMDTARRRGEYGYCRDSKVEHLHPVWRKARRDRVYVLGQQRNAHDYRLYLQRRSLWT